MTPKRTIPKTKEEQDWWRIGYEAGMKEALRKNEMAIKVGTPIIEAICEMSCTTSN